MLILTRKPEEVIRLGDDITVKVLSIKNGQVKLGIEAPRELRVFRAEIYEQVQQQNAEAARARKSAAMKAAARLGLSHRAKRDDPT
jgi:carbon storage regulator